MTQPDPQTRSALPKSTVQSLRHADSDRFLSALFAPAEMREHILVLYALDHELKRIPHAVSEPMLGAIRFQWWRDTVGAIYAGDMRGHALVPALAQAIGHADLAPAAFHAWLDAREAEMTHYPFATLQEMTRHATQADGTVMEMAARVLSEGALDADTAATARALGTAYGLTDMLRRLAAAATRRTAFVPHDMAGQGADMLFAGQMTDAAAAAFAAALDMAQETFCSARSQALPKACLPALLHAALVPGYVRLMRRASFDPLRTRADIPAYRRQTVLLARALRGRL